MAEQGASETGHRSPQGAGETTEDAFLGGALRIRQPRSGHRAGLDAVFLAAAVPVAQGRPQRVLEAGAGTGLVSLAIACRAPHVHVTGIERAAELTALAEANAAANGLADRVTFVTGDVTRPLSKLAPLGLEPEGYDHVVANPPFAAEGSVRLSPSPGRRAAHAMAPGELERWVRFLAAVAAPGGRLTMIHRPEALPALLAALGSRFGGIAVFPLFPRPGVPAHRILLCARKGSRAPLSLLPGMVLHESDGRWRPEAEAILRAPRALEIAGGARP